MNRKASVLIVEEDPKLRKSLSDILRTMGYVPIGAVKGKTALDRVKKKMPAVAIIDLKLPDMDGLKVMREIKKYSSDTECIVLSGYVSQASAIEAVNLGAYSYVQKPYDVEQLMVTIHRAIEKREAEEALRVKDSAIASSINAIALADLEGNLTYVNPSFLKLWGYDAKEVLRKPAVEFWQMEEKALEVMKALRDRGSWIGELVAKRKDGSLFDVQLLASMVTDEAGKPICMMGSFVDITERKRAEEALRESEERFRELVENANDIIYTHDLEGNFTSVNPAATRIYGYTPEEILQLNLADIVDPDYLPLTQQKIREKLEGSPRTGPYELLTYSKDGEPIWVEVSTRLVERDSQPVGVQGIARDITERKQAETALKSTALETLEALSRLVEANDPYTSGHSVMVTEIAIEIAGEMGLLSSQIDALRVAGPLHDVGKVGIPSSVLNKPTGLTQAEWLMIQAHPQVSASVAQQVTAFETAVSVIRHHHERWDGTGYPDGLKGDKIPLLARILAVADGFQAMTSERPYRRARTEEEALAELEKGAGTQWDPEVVKVFIKRRKWPTKGKGKGKRKARK